MQAKLSERDVLQQDLDHVASPDVRAYIQERIDSLPERHAKRSAPMTRRDWVRVITMVGSVFVVASILVTWLLTAIPFIPTTVYSVTFGQQGPTTYSPLVDQSFWRVVPYVSAVFIGLILVAVLVTLIENKRRDTSL